MQCGPNNKRTSHKREDETCRDKCNEDLKRQHVALTDALRAPRTVMVKLFNTEVAEVTMLRVNILARDRLTGAAELGLTTEIIKRDELGDWERMESQE